MPNYFVSSSRTKTAKDGDGEELEKGNSEILRSSDDVGSETVLQPGNISRLAKMFKLGEKGSGTRPLGALQDYNVLRKRCLKAGTLFEDTEFPAILSSLYGSKRVRKNIKWVRPPGFVPDPKLFVEGASRFDVKQGDFGDCWLLAAIANLATNKTLLTKVVPEDQSFCKGHYAGIFHFRFWQYGRWVDVVIDDRLPVFNGKLLGLHSATNNEFWTALLEKAYAKLHGSYTALEGGDTGDAMEDFTSGVAELYTGDSVPEDLFDVLLKAHEKNAQMGCSFKKIEDNDEDEADSGAEDNNEAEEDNETEEDNEDEEASGDEAGDDAEGEENEDDEDNKDDEEEETEEGEDDEEEDKLQGLIEAHAYSITQVKMISKGTNDGEKIPMVRVRNPWGTEDEWLGSWSDKSPEWQSIPEETKKELEFKSADDGEFWMCFQDFKDHLSDLEICYLNPKSVLETPGEREWEISVFEGEWVSGVTAGGSPANEETFQHNPQYLMTLEEECTVIVALMQKNRRIQGRKSVNFLHIGFMMVPLIENPSKKIPKPLDSDYFGDNDVDLVNYDVCRKKPAPNSQQFSAHRQVSCRMKLQPGSYCIIPCTYDTDEDGEFLLRVFSEKPHKIEEYHEELGVDEVDNSKNSEHRNKTLRDYFQLISGDDWELDWLEQKKVLDYTISSELLNNNGISKDACRSMVALLDVDRSGKLSFGEFQTFWKDIKNLIEVFKQTSVTDDGVEYLSTFDLRKALNKVGLHVNIHVLGRLVRRYGTEDKNITLEDFIICALRIKNMLGTFKERDLLKSNVAKFTLNEWIDNTLYL